jgi:ribonuclease J
VIQIGAGERLERVAHTLAGRVAIFDRSPIADEVLRERAQLGRAGVVAVTLAVDANGRVIAGPELRSLGVLGKLEADVLDRATRAVAAKVAPGVALGDASTGETIRLTARRSIEADTGRRTTVMVTVLRAR